MNFKPAALNACKVTYYGQEVTMTCPSISSASILLTFISKDTPLDLPTHLPCARAIAGAAENDGLTIETYAPALRPKMVTVGGSIPSSPLDIERGRYHNEDLNRAILSSLDWWYVEPNSYVPSILIGPWEGYFMVR